MHKAIAALFAISFLTSCGASTTYPGPWRNSGPAFDEIALTLGREHVLGCGEFYFKLANGERDPGLARVYCTVDGASWDAYLVNYKAGEVLNVQAEGEPPISDLGIQ